MMRVKMISASEEKCGIGAYARGLVSALSRYADVEYVGFPELHQNQEWFDLARRLDESSDVIHLQYHPHLCGYWRTPSQTLRFNAFIKAFSKPVVITVHDLLDHQPIHGGTGWRAAFYSSLVNPFLAHTPPGRFLSGRFLDEADHLIVHWRLPFDSLLKLGMKSAKVSILYPGIPDLSAGNFEVEVKAKLKGKRAFGIFGFIRPHKGMETAVQALAGLPEDIMLLLLGGVAPGEESFVASLKETMRSLGVEHRVIMPGYLPDEEAFAYLSACGVILLPYVPTMETASYSLSYAFSTGRPVLTSDARYFQELNQKYKVPAIFEKNNTEMLRRKILELIDGNSEFEKNSAQFRKEWSWDQVAVKTIQAYEKAGAHGA